MTQLYKLRSYPTNVYHVDEDGNFELIERNQEDIIKNYSGGISISKIHNQIAPLRKGYYRILGDDVGGDAPKDFIQVYEYGRATKANKKKWDKYIAKIGHKWYPLESVSEYLLNRIGEVLGLEMAFSQLRLVHGQMRFLSRYFLKEDEIMVHGAQIYSAYLLENDDRFVEEIESQNLARALLTFQFTDEAIKFSFPNQHKTIMNHLVELLVFDAITGNNDRHFYNWAIITDLKGKRPPKFSPIYDSARGLFWNIKESVINSRFYEREGKNCRINQKTLEKYLQSSRPKIGWEEWDETIEINHFQLISLINEHYPQHQKTCLSLIKNVSLEAILRLLDDEFITFYTPERYRLMRECLKQRFSLLQKLCKSDCYD